MLFFFLLRTQCMNVINMMSALCSKGKNNIQNILSFNKQKKTLTTAVTSQSSTGMSKPENISLTPSPEGGFTKVQTPLTQTTTHITFSSSGGTQRHLTVGLEVNDLSSEPENMESLKNDQYNATAPKTIAQGPYLNVKEHEKKSSTANRNLVILRKDNFKDEGNFNEIISKNVHIPVYSPKRQRPKKKWPSDSYKMDQNTLGNVTYLEHLSENEEDTTKNLSVQLTYLGNLNTTRDVINGTQEEGEKKLNFTLSEDRTPQTTIRSNATEKTSEANLVSTLTSLLDVYNIEETDKDGDIKEEKLKYEEIH
ncbi:uncharacterized protein [Pyxicephalus adspersus]|uniref:uncharacterized protein n=1 Tax=Pyxicephalus adspersus TaxID=30357 RepID=UPI003B58EEAC